VGDAQHAVAVVDRLNDDAERIDVRQLLEADLLVGHLAPDGVGLLLSPEHLGLDAHLGKLLGERLAAVLDQASVLVPELGKLAGDCFVGLGVQPAEGVVLELVAQRLHAHAAR
jgi:hypothetical protein